MDLVSPETGKVDFERLKQNMEMQPTPTSVAQMVLLVEIPRCNCLKGLTAVIIKTYI